MLVFPVFYDVPPPQFTAELRLCVGRIWAKLMDYCVNKGFIKTKDFFDSGPVPEAAPEWFALYIANESVSLLLLCFFNFCVLTLSISAGAMKLILSPTFDLRLPKRRMSPAVATSMPPKSVPQSVTFLGGLDGLVGSSGWSRMGPQVETLPSHPHWPPICCHSRGAKYVTFYLLPQRMHKTPAEISSGPNRRGGHECTSNHAWNIKEPIRVQRGLYSHT